MARALYIEASAVQQPADVLTPDSDALIFSASFSPFAASAGDPVVLPYGVDTGCVVTPTATDNEVSVSAGTAYMADNVNADATGRVTVSSGTLTVTRPTSTNEIIHAIIINAAGNFAVVAGTEGAEFSDTWGANGGPPLIPVDAVLVALIRLDSSTAAPITAAEIRQFPSATNEPVSQERWDFPTWREPAFAFDRSVAGEVEFTSAVPKIHTDTAPKRVILRAALAIMEKLSNVTSFTPAEQRFSSSSEDTFDGAIATQSASVNGGSFEIARLRDGIDDRVIKQKGKRCLFQFFNDEANPDRYIWTQGVCSPARSYEGQASNAPTATVTIAATGQSIEVVG